MATDLEKSRRKKRKIASHIAYGALNLPSFPWKDRVNRCVGRGLLEPFVARIASVSPPWNVSRDAHGVVARCFRGKLDGLRHEGHCGPWLTFLESDAVVDASVPFFARNLLQRTLEPHERFGTALIGQLFSGTIDVQGPIDVISTFVGDGGILIPDSVVSVHDVVQVLIDTAFAMPLPVINSRQRRSQRVAHAVFGDARRTVKVGKEILKRSHTTVVAYDDATPTSVSRFKGNSECQLKLVTAVDSGTRTFGEVLRKITSSSEWEAIAGFSREGTFAMCTAGRVALDDLRRLFGEDAWTAAMESDAPRTFRAASKSHLRPPPGSWTDCPCGISIEETVERSPRSIRCDRFPPYSTALKRVKGPKTSRRVDSEETYKRVLLQSLLECTGFKSVVTIVWSLSGKERQDWEKMAEGIEEDEW